MVRNFTELKNVSNCKINNIFSLENEINYFFTKYNDKSKKENSFLIGNYFTEKVEKQKGHEVKSEIQQIIYKYRNTIYDFIYKSKRSILSCQILDDIAISSIISDMKTDEFTNNKHLRYTSIRKKINIWFSLYNSYLFINNKTRYDMNALIDRHLDLMKGFSEEQGRIENDQDYGFVVGQVIYYILSKSRSSDKSYSNLVPFLQKTSKAELTKAIIRIFQIYAHENFSNKFKYAFGLIMEYDKEVNIKEIMPNILGGFFLPNKLFSDTISSTNNK